MANLTRI